MTRDEYLAALERDAQGFGDAAASADLAAPVRACPGWTMADLVWHLTEVHQFWNTIAEQRLQHWKDAPEPERVPDDELLATFRAGAARLLGTLRTTPPDTEVWTWAPQHDVGFIVRRQAQETAVHRWDAEDAAGRSYEIDPALAVDGIDEFLTFMLPDVREDADLLAGSVHLHCTDTDGEWIVEPTGDGDGVEVRAEHAKGDAAVRGTAQDLLLTLWRRRTLDDVEVIGERGVAEQFVARTNLD
jgi:uncharacterized protein (TIGR03083 family)